MTIPYWVQDAVFYQIFPDRFANGDNRNDLPNKQPWGSPPSNWGFQGGDLRGIITKFDYLLDLGINALYLTPIFLSPSNHRYNTTDYYTIDPRLGDLSDFKALLEVAHANQVRVVLDGVFNHCSRGFFAFTDLLENQVNSAYKDWFHVQRFPINAYSQGPLDTYLGWWGFNSMPKFNTDNSRVRRYLQDVARYWIEIGADGWRLDVPNEIDDDVFWAEFRREVKSCNRDAYLLGEIWTADTRWVGNDHFDGLMNYPLRDAVLEFLGGGLLAAGFADRIEKLLDLYPREHAYAMYLPLGTHDTERLRTRLDGNISKVELAYTFLFAYPGAPAIYYGDEIGMLGGKDPECRGAFPWNGDTQNHELRSNLQNMIAIRKKLPVLRRGEYRRVFIDDRRQCFIFARTLGNERVVVALNAGPTQRHVRFSIKGLGWEDGRIVRNLLGQQEYIVSGDSLLVSLQPWGGVWIH